MSKATVELSSLLHDSNHYGQGNFVSIPLKDGTITRPVEKSSFRKRFLSSKMDKLAAYAITNIETGEIYLGSTKKVVSRLDYHRYTLNLRKHHCHSFQTSFNATNSGYFDACVIFSETRDEAYDIEQYLLDAYLNDPLLLNIAINARAPSKGIIMSQENRHKISLGNKGKPKSKESIQKGQVTRLANGLPSTEKQLAALRAGHFNTQRAISVNGIAYESSKEACKLLGLSPSRICHHLKSDAVEYKDYIYIDKDNHCV